MSASRSPPPVAKARQHLYRQIEYASATAARLGLYLLEIDPSSPRVGHIPSLSSSRWTPIRCQNSRDKTAATVRRIAIQRTLRYTTAVGNDHARPLSKACPVGELVVHARLDHRFFAPLDHRYADCIWSLLTGDHPGAGGRSINRPSAYCIPLALLLCRASPERDRLIGPSMAAARTVALIRFILTYMPLTNVQINLKAQSLLGDCLRALLDASRSVTDVRTEPLHALSSPSATDNVSATSVATYPTTTIALTLEARHQHSRSQIQDQPSTKRRFSEIERDSSAEDLPDHYTLFGPHMSKVDGPDTSPRDSPTDALPDDGRALHEAGQALLSLSASTFENAALPSPASSNPSPSTFRAPLKSTPMPTSPSTNQAITNDSISSARGPVARGDLRRSCTTASRDGTSIETPIGAPAHRATVFMEEHDAAGTVGIDRIFESWTSRTADSMFGARVHVWRRSANSDRMAQLHGLGCKPIRTLANDVMRIDRWGLTDTFTLRLASGQQVKLAGEAAYVALRARTSAFRAHTVQSSEQGELCPIHLSTSDLSDSQLGSSYLPPAFVIKHDWLHRFHERAKAIELELPKFGRIISISSAEYQVGYHTVESGGTAWYYVLSGQRTFRFAPPEELVHFQLLANSTGSRNPSEVDLGVADFQSVTLKAGESILSPGGCPHAIVTDRPSVMLSSVMYHDYQIPEQIEMWTLETAHGVPDHLRYFEILNFWAMEDLHRRWSLQAPERMRIPPSSLTQIQRLSVTDADSESLLPAPQKTTIGEGNKNPHPPALPPARDIERLIAFVEQHAEHIALQSSGTHTIQYVLQECAAFRGALAI